MQEYKAAPAGPYLPPSSIWAPFPTSPYGRRAHLISAADAPKQPHAPPPPPATAEICRDGGNSSNEFARSRRRRRRRRLISRWPAAQGNPFLPSFLPSRLSVDRSSVRPSVRPSPFVPFFLSSNCFGLADMREFRSVSASGAAAKRIDSNLDGTESAVATIFFALLNTNGVQLEPHVRVAQQS